MLPVDADWAAVAAAISTRMAELKVAQKTLADRSKVSQATIRQLQRNYEAKERHPRTLEALSLALNWPANHLEQVAGLDTSLRDIGNDALQAEVAHLRTELTELRRRVDALERGRSRRS